MMFCCCCPRDNCCNLANWNPSLIRLAARQQWAAPPGPRPLTSRQHEHQQTGQWHRYRQLQCSDLMICAGHWSLYRVVNEPSQSLMFHNHRDGPYKCLNSNIVHCNCETSIFAKVCFCLHWWLVTSLPAPDDCVDHYASWHSMAHISLSILHTGYSC